MTSSLGARLREAKIRHYDDLIHDQSKDWLISNFKAEGVAPEYPVNVARLMRNLVWQMKERVARAPARDRRRQAPPNRRPQTPQLNRSPDDLE
jgi:hypothetical protein